MKNNQLYSFDIDNFTERDKKELIAKFDDMDVPGWGVVVAVYIPPERTTGGIFLPETAQDDAQYRNFVGLVVKKGRAAYLDPRFKQTGQWCQVGEWRTFPRHNGIRYTYKGIAIFHLLDDVIGLGVPDPREVNR